MAKRRKDGRVTLGRPDDRRREIEAVLRQRIVGGEWPPESRIPTRVELCAEFRAGPATIQRILADLQDDGCLRAAGSQGTFVEAAPPHLAEVAVVLPRMTWEARGNRFLAAIDQVAQAPRADGLRLHVYRGIDAALETPDAAALLERIRRRCVMGIFFATPPFTVRHSPIYTAPRICRCVVMTPDEKRYPGFSTVQMDSADFALRALAYLKAQGRQRIAVVSHRSPDQTWTPAIEAAGLTTRPWWQLAVDVHKEDACESLARLLFHPEQAQRPDGLIITDDNPVEALCRGIAEVRGDRVAAELDILATCNFPLLPKATVPVTYCGVDAAELLEQGLAALVAERDGGGPSHSRVGMHFAGDLAVGE